MPRAIWPLVAGRPTVEIVLTLEIGSKHLKRILLADTGAGSEHSAFELVLDEDDCLLCGSAAMGSVQLGGAYSGSHPIYSLRVQVPELNFDEDIEVVGVPSIPSGVDGISGFRFLNRFTYGNLGDRRQFGIET
jgi:hypothetical protein